VLEPTQFWSRQVVAKIRLGLAVRAPRALQQYQPEADPSRGREIAPM